MIKVDREEKMEKLRKVTKVRERGSCLGKSNVETTLIPVCLFFLSLFLATFTFNLYLAMGAVPSL